MGNVYISQLSAINGVAYHLQGGSVAKVEHRVNSGPWQPLSAQDGAFDSYYEPFILAINALELEPGTYLIEARAIDTDGKVEVNFASQEIVVAELSTTFLPIVMSRM